MRYDKLSSLSGEREESTKYLAPSKETMAPEPLEYGTRKNPTEGDNGVNITRGCSFTYKGYDRPLSWQEPEKAWLSGVLGSNFQYDYYPLEKVEGEAE